MGNINSLSIASVLFSGVQQRVLGLLFGHPDRSFFTNEIARLGQTGRGALQRELARLTASGLVSVEEIGHQKHYRANRASPIFAELRGIVRKTFGMADVLRDALAPSANTIERAFVYGSVASGTDNASSDIDLMVIGEGIDYSRLFELLAGSEAELGRKINPTLYAPEDFRAKISAQNHFVMRVLGQPKIMLIGAECDLVSGGVAEPRQDREAEA